MSPESQRSPYYDLYKGKTLLLKVSGRHLEGEKFEAITKAIRKFVSEGIRVVMVYGGGMQIDREWAKKHKAPRPKRDGVGLTTEEVLRDAVLPAYEYLRQRIAKRFSDMNPHIVEPANIAARNNPVGGNQEIFRGHLFCVFGVTTVFRHEGKPLTIIPFLGKEQDVTRDWPPFVNLNADDIVRNVVQNTNAIDEVMMVTETGGVLNKKGKVVPLLSKATIDEIIAGRHPDIEVKDGMLEKLREVREMLGRVAKVSLTDDPQKEIENWRGRGTLCINEDKLEFEPASEQDVAIFRQAHEDLAKEGKFRQRTETELTEAALHHFCLKIDGAPLAGLSLIPRGGEWRELACLWSSYPKNGIASRILQEALEEAKGHKIYALTSEENAKRLFEKMQFVSHGRLKPLQERPSFPLPKTLRDYDTAARNPYVLSSGLRKTMPSRADAKRISDFLREADAVEDGDGAFYGSRPNPQAGVLAKYALARHGRRIDEWKPVAVRYGLPYSVDLG
ncbi:hypothetical protein HYW83_05240 [Candidatus Peregrinibacteria bacterium]|nr:hypothetical protein [Candidatus Peregrinibacteria bacterium]